MAIGKSRIRAEITKIFSCQFVKAQPYFVAYSVQELARLVQAFRVGLGRRHLQCLKDLREGGRAVGRHSLPAVSSQGKAAGHREALLLCSPDHRGKGYQLLCIPQLEEHSRAL